MPAGIAAALRASELAANHPTRGWASRRNQPEPRPGADIRIALLTAIAVPALLYLARGLQRFVEAFIVLVGPASVVGGHGVS